MYICCFSLITSEIFQPTNRYRCQFVGKVMTYILSIKEIIQQRNKKATEVHLIIETTLALLHNAVRFICGLMYVYF